MKRIIGVILVFVLLLSGCNLAGGPKDFSELEVLGSMDLVYADQFSIGYLSDGLSLVSITDVGRFLIVPEGGQAPLGLSEDIVVLYKPLDNIYLTATAAMCLFDSLDSLDRISMSGTKAEGWYIENARLAMERGDIIFAGKYSAPDYEMILAKACSLSIQSTMINHAPAVKEKLEDIGVPVLIERSSYESHPLGRTEWIKLYGHLFDKEELAESIFNEQIEYLAGIANVETDKTVAFFYINSAGNAVVRKNSDYVTKMIEMAGGNYVFTGLGENDNSATGSVNLSMEKFYAKAKEADIIIYNSSIDGEVYTIEELLQKSHLLADFKAVVDKNVWCTGKNLFQETVEFGLMISDMNKIFLDQVEDESSLNFLYRLK